MGGRAAGRGAGEQAGRAGAYGEEALMHVWRGALHSRPSVHACALSLTQCVVSTVSLSLSSPASVSYSVKWAEDCLSSLHVVRI